MYHRISLVAALVLGAAPLTGQGLKVPATVDTLPNGLRLIVHEDQSTPIVTVNVWYHTGSGSEKVGRTGFAHLFEHLMFQGSGNLGKLEFIKLVESNGGLLNGSTRFDFTNYFEMVPSHTIETMLWAEADRMKGLAIDSANLRNQQDVVKNEVRVNVLNQPYGSFPWIDLPMTANENWFNAHNFYGDLADLDAATLDDAAAFFQKYYAPNNAVLVVVGDFEPARTRGWILKYFGRIPRVDLPPRPDLTEPRQTAEKRASRVDSLATRPALGVAYHMPPRWTPEWFAFGLIDQILAQGRDSRLFDALVQEKGMTGDVSAGVNWGLGHQFNYEGPMLWMLSLYHDNGVAPDSILTVIDREVEGLIARPVDAATLARARTKLRASLYSIMESFSGFGTLDLLASFALFDNDPARINRLEAEFAKVTPSLIQRTATEYLRRTNRTVYTIVPGAKDQAAGGAQ